jgi:CubicO group peptidase (beta-lactamase class C family)
MATSADETTQTSPDLVRLHPQLEEQVSAAAEQLRVPGVAVGIYAGGAEDYVYHGVTSIENPLPVDAKTIFQIGSTGKTYTATVLMILAERGLVSLEAPVRSYVPELRLQDESVAERVTVLQLLNHTAGWVGDISGDTGDGDDALARFVAEVLPTLDQVNPLGSVASYNNSALNLAGRVIEKVTGKTYEAAVHDLLLEPAGLDESFFFMGEIMTRRFVVGHIEREGVVRVAHPWAMARSANPAGGVLATASDQIAYARFHLGNGTGEDGTRVLSEESLRRMREPTVQFGDGWCGISWMLQDIGGTRIAAHGGSTIGQQSAFVMVPERDFAVTVLTNAHAGLQLHNQLVEWVLKTYLGVAQPEEQPLALDPAELAAYAGKYDGAIWIANVSAEDDHLRLTIEITDKGREEMGEEAFPFTPARLVILPQDRFLILDGEYAGLKANFIREDDRITAINVGRIAHRID